MLTHWRLAIFVLIATLMVGLTDWLYKRHQQREVDRLLGKGMPIRRVWKYVRYQGGGALDGPREMDEAEAIEFCRSLGAVAYVDRQQGFIFYRPASGL